MDLALAILTLAVMATLAVFAGFLLARMMKATLELRKVTTRAARRHALDARPRRRRAPRRARRRPGVKPGDRTVRRAAALT